jgi:hypothetical protein
MVKKILVTGFPHSGTTILRAKIGECKSTYDCNYECVDPPDFNPEMQYDFYVWKHPFLDAPFRNNTFAIKSESKYADTIVIPIIRNPWHIFSSLHKRGTQSKEFSIYDNRQGHSLPWYENTCEVIFDAFQKNYKDVYPIKYEEMFDNNFEKLRNIFDSIGLEYDNDIFEKRTKEFSHGDAMYVEDYDKNGKYDGGLRAWQINQPFKNMNGDINLPDDFSQMLANSPNIQKLGYSDPRITD